MACSKLRGCIIMPISLGNMGYKAFREQGYMVHARMLSLSQCSNRLLACINTPTLGQCWNTVNTRLSYISRPQPPSHSPCLAPLGTTAKQTMPRHKCHREAAHVLHPGSTPCCLALSSFSPRRTFPATVRRPSDVDIYNLACVTNNATAHPSTCRMEV